MKKSIILLIIIFSLTFSQEKSAGKAMLLCLVPGGGQFYTGRYIHGIVIAGGEATLGYFAYQMHAADRSTERNSLLWYLAFLFGYSLADAYVGAKLFNFKADSDIDKEQAKLSLGVDYRW